MFQDLYQSAISMEVTPLSACIKLVVSFILGAIVGLERQKRRRSAGIRTFSLICMGSTAAMLLSIWIPQSYPNFLNGDPGRIAAQILTGIGFLGAGSIIQSRGNVQGLTTAAAVWVVAIIGMCVGGSLYIPAFVLTVLSLFVLITIERFEQHSTISGETKELSILFDTENPPTEEVIKLIKNQSIYIFNTSVEKDFQVHTTLLNIRVQIGKEKVCDRLFEQIQKLGSVQRINLDTV